MKKLLYIVIAIIATGTLSALGSDAEKKAADITTADKAMSDYFFMEGVNQKTLGNSDAAMALFDEALRLNPSATEAYYEKSMIYIEYEMVDSALNTIRNLVAIDSTQQRYNYALALLSAEAQLFDESEKTLLRIIENDPEEELAYAYLVDIYKEKGEYEKALHYIDQLIAYHGISEEILHYQSNLHIQLNDTTQAINCFEEIVALFPYDRDNFLLLSAAYEYFEMDSLQKDALLRGLGEHPHSIELHTALGEYYAERNDIDGCTETINNLLNINNNEQDKNLAIENIITATYRQDYCEMCIALLQMWLEKEPHNEYARTLYAQYLKKEGNIEEALHQLSIVVQENDEGGVMWEQLASEYTTNNMYDQGIEAATISVNAGNTSFSIYHILALCHSLTGNYDTAQVYAQMSVDSCDRSLFTNEEYSKSENNDIYMGIMSDLLGLQGDIALKQGYIEQCYQYYDSALVYNANNINILNNYAFTLACNGGDLSKAEMMSLKVLRYDDTTAAYIDTYAWILFKKEQYTLARIYMDRAILLASDNDEDPSKYYEHYGDIMAMNGNIDLAVEYWEKAIDAGLTSPTLEEKIKLRKYIKE